MEGHELDAKVVVQVPVEAGFPLIENAYVRKIRRQCTCKGVLQIEAGEATGNFPGSEAIVQAAIFAADEPERRVRLGNVLGIEPADALVVLAGFAREEVADLDISTGE